MEKRWGLMDLYVGSSSLDGEELLRSVELQNKNENLVLKIFWLSKRIFPFACV